MQKIKSPLKWYGGKTYLAKWIIDNFPDRTSYTHYNEGYAGGLSVLLAHDPEGKSETVNDISSLLYDFWSVLQKDPNDLIHKLSMTPLSEDIWIESRENLLSSDVNTRALSFFIRYRQSRQGTGKSFCTPTKRTRRGMNENSSAWLNSVDLLKEVTKRLLRVEIRNTDAISFIEQYDHSKSLFYLDPPYMHETRVTTKNYEYEMSYKDHELLLNSLVKIKGKFILSGYHSSLYDNWAKNNNIRFVEKDIDNKASSKEIKDKKTECLWMNY